MGVPRVLVIAGSDSSGGAGLEADQKVLSAHGVYAQTVTTALTAQNTLGVDDVHVIPSTFVAKQIDACMSDIGCDVVKIGMLASAETVRTVARKLREWRGQGAEGASRVVLDPVMVSTSGAQLLPEDAIQVMLSELVEDAELITPNVPEALLMLEKASGEKVDTPRDVASLTSLAKKLHETLKCKAVLLKGGHVPLSRTVNGLVQARTEDEREVVLDVLYSDRDTQLIESKYSKRRNTHGTGCSLASAIAAHLALGTDLSRAVKQSCKYVGIGISTSEDFSKGSGPINHFHNVQRLPFSQGSFLEYLLDRDDVRAVWSQYTNHHFANRMGDGTLPTDLFKEYLIQDYLYLTHFARVNALAAYKSTSMEAITASARIVTHIETEMNLHLEYCKEFGLSKEQIVQHKESVACVAYSRYCLDIGQSQDWLALQMSLAPCLLGYGHVAERLHAKYMNNHDNNKYWKWIENYVAEDYRSAVKLGSELIEKHIIRQSPSRIEELVEIFIRATEYEVEFWNLKV